MEDRLYRGFIAGIAGGVPATLLGQILYLVGFNTLRASDWASILIYAHTPPFSLGEQLFATFIYLGWCGAIGSLFAYFIVWVTDRKIFFKGWVLGTTPYFVIYLLTTLFQVPGTVPLPFSTALSNYITSTIFGVTMAYSFKVLDQAIAENRSPLQLLAHPAAKPTAETTEQRQDSDEKNGNNQRNRT